MPAAPSRTGSDRVRLGVIGLGAVAQAVHLPLLERLRDAFEIHAIADVSAHLIAAIGERYQVPPERRALSLDELRGLQRAVFDVYVDPALVSYAVAIATATRDPLAFGIEGLKEFIAYGASPRGPISLVQSSRALALVRGRDYVLAEDLHALSKDALRHRLVLTYQALAEEITPDVILDRVLATVPVPKTDLAASSGAA